MAIPKPYYTFGGNDKPKGGMADFQGAHYSPDEAMAQALNLHLAWYQIVVFQDETLAVMKQYPEPEKPKAKRAAAVPAD